jgi:hypothetical protein
VTELAANEQGDDLLRRIDQALYAAKRSGRNRVSRRLASRPTASIRSAQFGTDRVAMRCSYYPRPRRRNWRSAGAMALRGVSIRRSRPPSVRAVSHRGFPRGKLGRGIKSINESICISQIVCVPAELLTTGENSLEDWVRTAEFDPDQLESLMVAAFELLGKPEAEAQELARAILKAAERPQSGDPGSLDRDLT